MPILNTYTNLTSYVSDFELVGIDPNEAAAANKTKNLVWAYLQGMTLQPGQMFNGKITPTVSGNDLVLTLQTRAGANPSAADPVFININGTVRVVTAATSCTLADGTSWANAGSAGLGGNEIDWFSYAVYDSNSSVVAIAPSRIPNGRIVSDFSATTTNEKHLGNYANFTATDDVANIGRFAATLSLAGTSHLWTVPTFTNLNLIQEPCFKTRWLSFTPAYSCSDSMTYGTITTNDALYQFDGNKLNIVLTTSAGTVGGTPSITISSTIPFTAGFVATVKPGYGWTFTNSVFGAGFIYFTPAAVNIRLYNSGNWTAGSSFFGANGTLKY